MKRLLDWLRRSSRGTISREEKSVFRGRVQGMMYSVYDRRRRAAPLRSLNLQPFLSLRTRVVFIVGALIGAHARDAF